jgi:hypothetical protein
VGEVGPEVEAVALDLLEPAGYDRAGPALDAAFSQLGAGGCVFAENEDPKTEDGPKVGTGRALGGVNVNPNAPAVAFLRRRVQPRPGGIDVEANAVTRHAAPHPHGDKAVQAEHHRAPANTSGASAPASSSHRRPFSQVAR